MKKKQLLFVCVHNSCRSQMAEAFARHRGAEAYSAGSAPSGRISPLARAAMAEVGFDLEGHHSKSLAAVPASHYDAVIGMGCGDACAYVPARDHVEWNLEDPHDLETCRCVRDEIRRLVRGLLP